MKPRSPLKKISAKRLAAAGNKMPFSSISPSGKGVKRVNTKAKAKRTARYRKMLSGKEYKAARAKALVRAGNQCEATPLFIASLGLTPHTFPPRCGATEGLQAHHLRYPKSRPVVASDLVMLCYWHHGLAESAKLHKSRMF